jgi:hypothetical protein
MTERAALRLNAIAALKHALDANVVLTQVMGPEHFDEVRKFRDNALEEFVDEMLLAAEMKGT